MSKTTIAKIADKEVSFRLTKKHLKNARVRHGLDLSVMDMSAPLNSEAMKLITDPIFMTECLWAFFEEDLTALGFTSESFDDAIDGEVVATVREIFLEQCAAFFPFVKTVYTMLQGLQPGNLALTAQAAIEAAAKEAAQKLNPPAVASTQ